MWEGQLCPGLIAWNGAVTELFSVDSFCFANTCAQLTYALPLLVNNNSYTELNSSNIGDDISDSQNTPFMHRLIRHI